MALILALTLTPFPTLAFADSGNEGGLVSAKMSAVAATDVSAVSFVYLDSDSVTADAAQNIVVGFADETFVAEGAELVVSMGDQSTVLQQSSAVEGAALFTAAPGTLPVGLCELVELRFCDAEGTMCVVDFATDEAADYRFEVTEAAEESEASAEELSTSVFTINDESEFVEVDDIVSAMAAAGVDPMAGPEAALEADTPEGVMSAQESDGFVIVLDPGHGGKDGGAGGIGFNEKDVNLKIAQYCKAALEKTPGVTVYMTRTDDTYVSLEDRANFAIEHHADLLVAIHNNSSDNANAKGAEVIVPRDGAWYYSQTYLTGNELGEKILKKITALGLATHGGVYSKDFPSDGTASERNYADGTRADYYAMVRNPRKAGILGIIIEHAFVSNEDDAKFLRDDANLKKLGEADAQAILEYYDSSEGIDRLYWGVYDFDYYMEHYPDVKALYGTHPLQAFGYFKSTGMDAAQRGNVLFDVTYYKDKYGDLRKAFGDDPPSYYRHFIEFGMSEGRQASAEFSPQYYKANYSDLRSAFGSDWTLYYKHYLEFGIDEKRSADVLLEDALIDVEAVAMYRLYNPNSGEHFYTADVPERNGLIELGWRYEGVGWSAPSLSRTPVYRLYNPVGQEHHYTTDEVERDTLVKAGWNDEGIGWYSDDAKGRPLYRQYNPNMFSCNHNYTVNAAEKDNLLSLGWRDENIGWYGLNADAEEVPAPVADDEAIMGASKTSAAQMARRYKAMGKSYPSAVYTKYGAATIEDFSQIIYEEANAEGVRAEVVFAQAMHETGWLQYGGDVSADQCNFSGIGATGNGAPGNSFNTYGTDSVRMGIRAQVQHLKAYASTDDLVNPRVDPRFTYVTRGCAPTVQELSGRWASGTTYGDSLVAQIRALLDA